MSRRGTISDSFTKATELDPAYSRAWTNLGRLALAEGNELLAIDLFRRAAARGSNNPVAYANLGMMMMRSRNAAASEYAYRRATEIAPGMVPAWRGLARALYALDDRQAADRALDRALRLSPRDPLALEMRKKWDAAAQ
jgi:tetratricopeptide (TPR) repeat protein